MSSQGRAQQNASFLSSICTPGLFVGLFFSLGFVDGGGGGEALFIGNYLVSFFCFS